MPELANMSNIKKIGQRNIKPREIVDPLTLQVTNLDDISVKLSKLIDITTLNQKYLNAILKEQRDEADEGQELTQDGTVLSTDFTFIDIGQLRQGLRVKSFELANDSTTNSLYFAYNTTKSGLEPSLDDTTSSLTKFRLLLPGESIKIIFNRRVIMNIALLGNGASVPYRLWMVW